MSEGLGNGRVSLGNHIAALMSANDDRNTQRFDEILRRLEAMEQAHKDGHGDHSKRIRAIESAGATTTERWESHRATHKREATNQRIFTGILATIESSLAAVIAVLVRNP